MASYEKRSFDGATLSTTMAPVAVCTPMPDWEGAEERETDFKSAPKLEFGNEKAKRRRLAQEARRELKGWSESATAFGMRQSSAAFIATRKPER